MNPTSPQIPITENSQCTFLFNYFGTDVYYKATDVSAIIGGVIGGVVALVAIIVTVSIICCRARGVPCCECCCPMRNGRRLLPRGGSCCGGSSVQVDSGGYTPGHVVQPMLIASYPGSGVGTVVVPVGTPVQ